MTALCIGDRVRYRGLFGVGLGRVRGYFRDRNGVVGFCVEFPSGASLFAYHDEVETWTTR